MGILPLLRSLLDLPVSPEKSERSQRDQQERGNQRTPNSMRGFY
jgi:hypothetical protein